VTTPISQSEVVANAQRVVISVTNRGTTETVVQIGVPATTADYGVLIPTPSEPTLDPMPIAASSMDALDAATRPTILKDYSSDSSGSGMSCGCGSSSDDDASSGSPDAGEPVNVSIPTNIGPVTAVTLTATDATALNAWLNDNGFAIPDERQALLASYVGAGRYFIAVKRNDAAADGGPTSIALHYTLTGDHRLLSLAFARLGAAPTVAFTLFLFAPEMALPSDPFQALSLDDLDAKLLFNGDYQGAVKKAVKAHGAQAFVLEAGLMNPTAFDTWPASVIDENSSLVRMTTVVAADDLTEDATFFAAATAPIEHSRTIQVVNGVVTPASVGVLGFIALARAVRRRGRRPILQRAA
jgi:hypothetical protein